MITHYMKKIDQLLQIVQKEETSVMDEAAKQMSQAIQSGNIVHLFGSGHSHMLTEELFYRAGGLVPIQPILHEPLMLHKGAVKSSTLEREANYAQTFMDKQDIRSGDVLFVISTSGRNAVPIDVAKIGKKAGAYVIGLTSVEYSSSQPSRHKSGKLLHEVVDLVIDSHVPIGDALLGHENVAIQFAPSSTVIGATILNAIVAEAINDMANNNFTPPIFLSGNIEGADAHNNKLIDTYRDRIKLLDES